MERRAEGPGLALLVLSLRVSLPDFLAWQMPLLVSRPNLPVSPLFPVFCARLRLRLSRVRQQRSPCRRVLPGRSGWQGWACSSGCLSQPRLRWLAKLLDSLSRLSAAQAHGRLTQQAAPPSCSSGFQVDAAPALFSVGAGAPVSALPQRRAGLGDAGRVFAYRVCRARLDAKVETRILVVLAAPQQFFRVRAGERACGLAFIAAAAAAA